MYQTLFSAMEQEQAEIGICGFLYCAENGAMTGESQVPAGGYTRDELISSIYGMPNQLHGSMCNKLFAASVLQGLRFDAQVAIGEDWLLLYECYLRTKHAVAVNLCGYTIRVRNASATRKVSAELYVNKQKTYYRLYTYAEKQNREIRKQAVQKVLDACYTNKRLIVAECYDRTSIGILNRQLRCVAIRELFRGNLTLKHAIYHYWKGLQSK